MSDIERHSGGDPSSEVGLERLWPHVDHDLAQLSELHREINSAAFAEYPEPVRRAINVAYAAHFRTIMEFAHGGRPPRAAPKSVDITSSGLLGESLATEWSEEENARLADADKLVAHLSTGRLEREGRERDWGDAEDLQLWKPYLEALLSEHADRLPRSSAARARMSLEQGEVDSDWERAWYHEAVADIRWAKGQATSVTRWALLLQGAVLGLSELEVSLGSGDYRVILGVITVVGVGWLADLHFFAMKARGWAEKVQGRSPERLRPGGGEAARRDPNHWTYLLIHGGLIVAGAVLVWIHVV